MVRRRYSMAVVLILAAGSVVLLLLPPALRSEAAWGAAIALVLQAPLGWWTLRSIGTPRFQLAWTVGMGIRLLAVGGTALVLVPALGWNAGPVLGSMVTTLLMLLGAEVVTAMRAHSQENRG